MAYITTPQAKKRRGQYYQCETCKTEFYVMPSYIRKAEKNGTQIRFCSAACYKKDGAQNPMWGRKHKIESVDKMLAHPKRHKFLTGEENPNFRKYGTEFGFRGSRSQWWRKYLLETVGKCERCEFPDKRVLNLHHRDRNRANNTRDNLELLCWNCHAIDHYEAKDGFYHFFANDKDRKRYFEAGLGLRAKQKIS